MDAHPGHHPPGRLREELRAVGRRQVHVPRPPGRAQDPDPPGGRGDLRRARSSRSARCRSSPSRSAAASTAGRTRAGRRRSSSCAPGEHDPALRGPARRRRPEPMPIRKHKPTTPGRRFVDLSRTSPRSRKTEPEKSLVKGKKSGGRNTHGRMTAPPPRRRRQAPVPARSTSSAARTACRRRSRAIEYDPNRTRLHRAAALRRRREALHPGARSG